MSVTGEGSDGTSDAGSNRRCTAAGGGSSRSSLGSFGLPHGHGSTRHLLIQG